MNFSISTGISSLRSRNEGACNDVGSKCEGDRCIASACELGALVGREDYREPLRRFGHGLGMAFQIADDVLDYNGEAETMGKSAGKDIAEGKPTLPLILARERCDAKERELLDEAIRNGGADDLNPVLEIIEKTGSIKAAMEIARSHAREAM